jgi:hypothetical protein
MISLLWLLCSILTSPFKSKCQLEAENVALRHQVIVLRRQVRGRVRLWGRLARRVNPPAGFACCMGANSVGSIWSSAQWPEMPPGQATPRQQVFLGQANFAHQQPQTTVEAVAHLGNYGLIGFR